MPAPKVDLDRPQETSERKEADPGAAPTAPESAAPPPITPHIQTFAEKYAGRSRYELAGALGTVRARRIDLQQQITQELEKAGKYITLHPKDGEEVNVTDIARTAADRRPSRAGVSIAEHVSIDGGTNEMKVLGIPPGDYPEFDALQDEEMWLSGHVEEVNPATGPGHH
jgi:hypothetical protein